jgi:hypothetical protein
MLIGLTFPLNVHRQVEIMTFGHRSKDLIDYITYRGHRKHYKYDHLMLCI